MQCVRRYYTLSRIVEVTLLWISLSVTTWWCASAQAQERFDMGSPQDPRPIGLKVPQRNPSPVLPRPDLPSVQPMLKKLQRIPSPQLLVQQIKVVGSTIFSDKDLAEVTSKYVDRFVTMEELEAVRRSLTHLYVSRGYVNSIAILPDQTVIDGIVTFQIIEGTLGSVTIKNNSWFQTNYLRSRLALDVKPPLHIASLEERLQLLQQDDRIERLDAELRPGERLGVSTLHVNVKERVPFFMALEFNNYQSPTIGAERGLVTVAHQNLTRHGDILRFTFWRSAGLDLQVDTNYTLPISPRETSLSFRYQRTDSSVVEDVFDPLDIESQSEIFTVTLRHPLYRTPRQELALAFTGEHLRSETFLLGQPFSFSLGAQDGETVDTALRLSVEWVDRTPRQVFAVQSQFSLGIDALGATINDDPKLPDGRFFKWLGQFQWIRRLGERDIQLLFRLNVQLTTEPLLPLEQASVGGRFTVRGYRENTMVRDKALVASLETRIPLFRNRRWAEFMRLVPFVDFGRARNRKVPTPDPTNLASIGLGLQWAATWRTIVPLRAYFEVFWGYKLVDVETSGGDLQDKGLHLQFVLSSAF